MLSLLKVDEDPLAIMFSVDCAGMPPAPQKRIEVLRNHWACGFKWLLKLKLGIEYDGFNPRRKLERGLKPFGQRLTLLYELCIQLHAIEVGTRYGEFYKNGSEWFQAVARELWHQDVWDCLYGNSDSPGKVALRQEMSSQIKSLRGDENPLDASKQLHSWRLFEAAINTAGQYPAFQAGHWHPYLRAWASQAKSLESSDFVAWDCVNGRIGKGKRSRNKDRPLNPFDTKGLQL